MVKFVIRGNWEVGASALLYWYRLKPKDCILINNYEEENKLRGRDKGKNIELGVVYALPPDLRYAQRLRECIHDYVSKACTVEDANILKPYLEEAIRVISSHGEV